MRDRVLQPRRDPQPLVQIVRAPVHQQLGVQRLREYNGVTKAVRRGDRLRRELHGLRWVTAIDPGPG